MTKWARVVLFVVVGVSLAVSAAQEPQVTDGDGVPPGLTEEQQEAWLWAHSESVVVTP